MPIPRDKFIVVTGGRGFIGRAVTKLLHYSGYPVLSLDQSAPTNAGTGEGQSLHQVICDITDATQLSGVFSARPVTAVIHLAAVLPTAAQRNPAHAAQVNTQGTLNLLEAARRHGVRRFVFGSSLSVYGTWPADYAVSESDRAAPEDLYGAAKLYVEQLGSALGEIHNFDFVSLRIGRVVGPDAHSETSAWRSEIFELLGSTQHAEVALPYASCERLLLVYVEDVAKMLVTLLEQPSLKHTIYNAPCESMTVAELKEAVEGLNVNIKVVPGEKQAVGNPQLLDFSRFEKDFSFEIMPIRQQLRLAAGKST